MRLFTIPASQAVCLGKRVYQIIPASTQNQPETRHNHSSAVHLHLRRSSQEQERFLRMVLVARNTVELFAIQLRLYILLAVVAHSTVIVDRVAHTVPTVVKVVAME